MSRARERAVQSLQELYTIAVGLGLATAIAEIIDTGERGLPLRTRSLPLFAAFLATLVPFYQGTIRHLDRTYVEEGGRGVRPGVLLGDFFLLFVQACVLFAAARLLPRSWYAAWALVALLAFDAMWGALSHFLFHKTRGKRVQRDWILINVVFSPAIAMVLIATWGSHVSGSLTSAAALAVLALALVRTAIDYWRGWNFYYPQAGEAS